MTSRDALLTIATFVYIIAALDALAGKRKSALLMLASCGGFLYAWSSGR